MLHLLFKGLLNEDENKDNHANWKEWRSLQIYDIESDQFVAEWFYVVATTDELAQKFVSTKMASPSSILVQPIFNELELLAFAKNKFEKLTFNDWPDFYTKMSKEFTYVD